ncbi:tautomerase family protein [Paraburkholderia youngii]|uniref:tautomerase family protein n=1 Tax=Paraburkholderia youngii TaxID=2782701 RepID=UPI003D209AC0
MITSSSAPIVEVMLVRLLTTDLSFLGGNICSSLTSFVLNAADFEVALHGNRANFVNGALEMPLVRINLTKDASPEAVRAISDTVYEAMINVANVPQHDKFQIITRHALDELVYPTDGYLGISYSPGIVFIQGTWNAGRTIDVKKAFYKVVADGIHAKAGVRKEDIWISLIDVAKENWSFGNGEMQYAPKE